MADVKPGAEAAKNDSGLWPRIKAWASALKRDVLALWFCCKRPDTPLAAKLVAAFIAAYVFSPIDLIPDFIPVLGYVDEVILVPIGVWFALKLVPPAIMADCRRQASDWFAARNPKPRNYVAAAVILAIWIGCAWLLWRAFA